MHITEFQVFCFIRKFFIYQGFIRINMHQQLNYYLYRNADYPPLEFLTNIDKLSSDT